VRRTKSVWVLGVAALLFTLIATPAAAGARTRSDGVDGTTSTENTRASYANFEGRTIDLAGQWGEAQACLVWRQGGVSECFRTTAELDAREKELAPQRETAARDGSASKSYGSSCSSSLRLYEHNWYSGRRLSFWDRGYWQNLSWYGFEDQVSSYIVGGCQVYLAEHANGEGWWYPGPTFPYSGSPAMYWGWQDTISSIYIG